MFNLWFNTAFIENGHAIFYKPAMDKGFKDKRVLCILSLSSQRQLAPNFSVEVFVENTHERPVEFDLISAAMKADTVEYHEISRCRWSSAIYSRFITPVMLAQTLDLYLVFFAMS